MNQLVASLSLLVALIAVGGVGLGQDSGWPLVPLEVGDGEVMRVALLEEELGGLSGLDEWQVDEVSLPGGRGVSLNLQRIDLERLQLGPRVNGLPWAGSMDSLELSVWHGSVRGVPGSEVSLAFSRFGCHGWIREGEQLVHLMSDGDPRDGWGAPRTRWVSDRRVIEVGGVPEVMCAQDQLGSSPGGGGLASIAVGGSSSLVLGDSTYLASIAIEADYQYFQVFGDINATLTYVVTLFAWVSHRYEVQVGTVLTLPYINVNTNAADPWSTPDTGGDCIDMIYEFQAAWAGNVPMGADIGHFLSGAPLGCGAGFIGGLCEELENFSVCGNGNGQVPFPVSPHDANLDFYLVSHELGHNFGAIHTHDYCPPIDECPGPAYFGQCQTQQSCSHPGTLMSYCHACGGFSNISTWFHEQSALDMRAHVETRGCLPVFCPEPEAYCDSQQNSDGCTPGIEFMGATSMTGPDDFHVKVGLIPAGKSGLLFYGASPTSVPLLGGTLCVDSPQVRTPVLNSGGTIGMPCDGEFDFHWSQAFSAAEGLGAGDTVFAQFWYRDPLGASGTGLTDAVQFTLCP